MNDNLIILLIFLGCYALALSRKVKIAYASLGASAILLALGYLRVEDALFKAIKWDVLGIYWGFMMVSYVFARSRMPELIANKIMERVRVEKYVLLSLCGVTAFLSAFMENVGVVLIMAPVAISVAKRYGSSLFPYLISIAISSNVVTTVTMVADPPSIILALETGMKPLDFYWFEGRPGLGTLSICGVVVALLTLLLQFTGMKNKMIIQPQKVHATKGASILFFFAFITLLLAPQIGIPLGIVGLTVGIIALLIGRKEIRKMVLEFDWNSFFFIVGVFMVIYSVNQSGLLKAFTEYLVKAGLASPILALGLFTWISVALSSFIDNIPYTVLMIPVVIHQANLIGMSQWPLLYGMLVGTGIGGNITPVGAAANVFACGILEREGYKVSFKTYLKIGGPFSVAAVATVHILLQIFWL